MSSSVERISRIQEKTSAFRELRHTDARSRRATLKDSSQTAIKTMSEKIALALEPKTEEFSYIPLMKVLVGHLGNNSWLDAKHFVLDLAAVAPQVV